MLKKEHDRLKREAKKNDKRTEPLIASPLPEDSHVEIINDINYKNMAIALLLLIVLLFLIF